MHEMRATTNKAVTQMMLPGRLHDGEKADLRRFLLVGFCCCWGWLWWRLRLLRFGKNFNGTGIFIQFIVLGKNSKKQDDA